MVSRWIIFTFCIAVFAMEAMCQDPIHVRAKRQQCRCVRNPVGGGMTCSCTKPAVSPGASLLSAESQQQSELAHELQTIQSTTSHTQARCACIQIVFHGNPQYQCQCGDQNGNPLPSTTTMAATTTTYAPTTTTAAPTTTTLPPTTTTPAADPVHTTTQGNGQCQCIMIRISGPASAHYQCNCQNTANPSINDVITPSPVMIEPPAPSPIVPVESSSAPELPSETPVFPPVGTINSTEKGCFCVDQNTNSIEASCGCVCDCTIMLCNMPSGVCACPQDSQGHPLEEAAAPEMTTPAPAYEPVFSTLPPVTMPPVINEVIATEAPHAAEGEQQYPLTTTCVMYVGVQASPCMCLPQYDQCAQNICCLKAKFRSHKKTAYQDQEPSTIDMLMNVLQKIKTKLDH